MAPVNQTAPPFPETAERAAEAQARREAERAAAELLEAEGLLWSHEANLYETDYYVWLARNAALIRAGRVSEADLDNIAEELEDMARSEKRALGSQFVVLIQHLLKWQLQPRRRSKSWRLSIDNARDAIEELLGESPSLRRRVPEFVAGKFPLARRNAITETGLPESGVPETCPYSPEQVLDPTYWPEQGE